MGPSISRLFAFSLVLLSCGTAAQPYPQRPVRIIVPAQPGGGLDLVGRTVAEQLTTAFGKPFVVENVSGGGGIIAAQAAARAAPDGYTLMVGYVGTHGTNPAVRKLPYDAVRDFTPIAMVGGTPNVLVVQPSAGIGDLKALVSFARATSGKLAYASGGLGTLNHLIMEEFRADAGFEAVVAHYRGIGPAINDFLGGQTLMMMPGLAAALPYIRASRMRPVAITGQARHPLLPEVPTFAEQGYEGFDSVQWYGIVAPAHLSPAITEALNAEINRALDRPKLRERLAAEAIDPMPMSASAFGEYIASEVARWTAVARKRGISMEE